MTSKYLPLDLTNSVDRQAAIFWAELKGTATRTALLERLALLDAGNSELVKPEEVGSAEQKRATLSVISFKTTQGVCYDKNHD